MFNQYNCNMSMFYNKKSVVDMENTHSSVTVEKKYVWIVYIFNSFGEEKDI